MGKKPDPYCYGSYFRRDLIRQIHAHDARDELVRRVKEKHAMPKKPKPPAKPKPGC